MRDLELSIVIPAHNEELRLSPTIEAYHRFYTQIHVPFEIIVVCNGCSDGTHELARSYSHKLHGIRVFNFPDKIGKGGAIKEGFRQAWGKYVMFVDADNSTNADQSYKLFIEIRWLGYKTVVVGSKKSKGSQIPVKPTPARRVASWAFAKVVKLLFGLPVNDTQTGAKVFTKDAALLVADQVATSGWAFDTAALWMLCKKGYAIREVAITWRDSPGSNLKIYKAVPSMAVELLRIRFQPMEREHLTTEELYRRISLGLIYVICLTWMALWAVRTFQFVGYPQMEYSEGFMLYNAQLFADGKWSWNLATSPPYTTSFYTPIFYYLLGWLMKILGNSLVVGRLFVLGCGLVTLFFVYLIISHFTKNKALAMATALLPATQPAFIGWSVLVRVDVPAIMFEIAGLYVAVRFIASKWVWASIPLFVLAFYTKQMFLAAAGATCVYLILQNRRQGLIYTAVLAGIGGGIMAVGTLLTHGGFFDMVFLYQRTNPTYKPFDEIGSLVVTSYAGLTPMVVLAFIAFMRDKRHILSLFALASFALNVVLIGRLGGSTNYQMEVIFAFCLASGITLNELLKNVQSVPVLAMFAIPVITLIGNNADKPLAEEGYIQRYAQVKAIISDATYPVLTECASVVLDAGNVPYYEPFAFSQLTYFKYWDDTRLLQDLKDNRIQYVIAKFPLPYYESYRFTKEVQEAIVANYHIVYSYWQPKDTYNFVVYKANKWKGGKEVGN